MMTEKRIYERRWKMLTVLSVSMMIIGLDNTIVNVALPTLQRRFAASVSDLQWVVDAYLLVFAATLLTMGTLGDHYGRKRTLQGGLLLFASASTAVLLVSSVSHLIVLRVLMGLGAALIMPATLSIITNVFPRAERGRAIGIWAGTAAIGIGLGPLTGGLLLQVFAWQSVFLVNVPVAVVALLLGIRLVPDSRDPKPGAFDLIGAMLSATALLAFVWAVIEAPSRGWTSIAVIVAVVAAALLAAAFIAWERHVDSPMLNLVYFRNPRFSIGSLSISIIFFSLMAAIFALTQYLQYAHGYSALQAGATMLPLALGLMLSATSSSRFVTALGTKRVVAGGLILLALVLAATVLWTPGLAVWLIIVWWFVLGLAMGSVMAPATDSVMGSVPPAKAGVASAMNDVTRQVGGALGVAIVGSLIDSIYSNRMGATAAQLPAALRGRVQASIGAADAVATHVPPIMGTHLTSAAAAAFTTALGSGLLIATTIALIGAGVVVWKLPARHAAALETLEAERESKEPAVEESATGVGTLATCAETPTTSGVLTAGRDEE
jgi:EmrB/QacA subfamily drug resistance transporter